VINLNVNTIVDVVVNPNDTFHNCAIPVLISSCTKVQSLNMHYS